MLTLRSVNHIGIRITDRARSVEFYARLGFQLVWEQRTSSPPPVVTA